jgi:hypothetical protein
MAKLTRQTSLKTNTAYDNKHRMTLSDLRELVQETKSYAPMADVLLTLADDTESITVQVTDAPNEDPRD